MWQNIFPSARHLSNTAGWDFCRWRLIVCRFPERKKRQPHCLQIHILWHDIVEQFFSPLPLCFSAKPLTWPVINVQRLNSMKSNYTAHVSTVRLVRLQSEMWLPQWLQCIDRELYVASVRSSCYTRGLNNLLGMTDRDRLWQLLTGSCSSLKGQVKAKETRNPKPPS